jgi:hypothetical protein
MILSLGACNYAQLGQLGSIAMATYGIATGQFRNFQIFGYPIWVCPESLLHRKRLGIMATSFGTLAQRTTISTDSSISNAWTKM